MELHLLGPLQLVSDRGERINIPQRLMRAAVVALALHRDQPVPQARLIDVLWGPARDTRDPAHSLRNTVWGLRRHLPVQRLVTSAAGYRLRIEANDQVDVDTFQSLHRQAQAAWATGEAPRTVRLLEEALALWRDPPLPQLLPATPAMGALIAPLVEELRTARTTWVRARMALGEDAELLPELRALVAADPANEALWAGLMRALYRSARKADALAAFAQLRAALAAHTGAEPSIELFRLRDQIAADDPALRPPESAEPAAARLRATGTGWVVPHQLPPDVVGFAGRLEESATLTQLLSDPRRQTAVPVVEITGPPGVGKTALAVRIAHQVADRYGDGQVYLPLAGSSPTPRTPHALLGELLRAVGIPGADIPDGLPEREGLARTCLAGRNVLVVYDDAASADQVRPLVPGAPGCAVIVTGRTTLAGLSGARHLIVEPLSRAETVDLLAGIVGRHRCAAEPDAAQAVADACGGLPLAVRIAAERLASRPTWPIAHMARLLADERHRLDALVAGDQGVRASFALSYQALNAREQRGFRLLALAGSHSVAGWVFDMLLGDPASEVVDALVDHGLVATAGVDAVGQPRYRLHDLLASYAAELLADSAERREALDRLLAGCIELAGQAAAVLPRLAYYPPGFAPGPATGLIDAATRRIVSTDPRGWLDTERHTLRAVIDVACANGHHEQAMDLAAALASFLHLDGLHDDAEQMWITIARAAETAGDEPSACRAWLRAATVISADRGDPARALPLLDRCVGVFETTGDHGLMWAYTLRAYATQALGQLDEARRDAERGLMLAHRRSEAQVELSCLRVLGLALSKSGDHDRGIAACEQALAVAREFGDLPCVGITLYTLIQTRLLADRVDDGLLALCDEGVAISERIAHQLSFAYFHRQAGLTYQRLGRHDEAINALQLAMTEFDARRENRRAAECQRLLADSYNALGLTTPPPHGQATQRQAWRVHLDRPAPTD